MSILARSIASGQRNILLRTITSSTSPMSGSRAPIQLVSVNTFPDRAKNVVGKVIEGVKDKYTIVHAGNSTTIEGVKPLLESIQPPPGILFCASMWTPEQASEIIQIARDTVPGIKTHAIPTGLHVTAGPEGIVKYLTERIDDIVNQ